MRVTWFGIFLGLVLAGTAGAELPPSFRGWQSPAVETISTPQLDGAAGSDAAVVREYGFLGAERRQYSKQNAKLTVTLWRMQDATASYGLFTYRSKPGMTAGKLGASATATTADLVLFQKGPYLLEVQGEGLTAEDAAELGAKLPDPPRGGEGLLPPVPSYLPQQGLIAQSQKFLIGPAAFGRVLDRIPASAIGFQLGAEAALAEYRIEGRETLLLLVSYPTPQLAAKMLRAFQSLPALAQNASGRTMFIERKGSLVAFVMDAPNLASTEKLLNQVSYGADVTWNEYVPPRKENVGSVMMAIFSLAGFLMAFSFVAGLAFGGVRVLAKRFIPISIFDRPSQLEIIQLNLTDR